MKSKLIIEKNGDIKEYGFDELYHSRKWLRDYIKYKYKNIKITEHELESIVDFGFYKAVRDYNYEKGVKFDGFCTQCLDNYCKSKHRDSLSNKEKAFRDSYSLDYSNSDCDEETSFINIIEDDRIVDTAYSLDYKEKLRRLTKPLNENEQAIIFYLLQGFNLAEISSFINLSAQRTQMIYREMQKKIKLIAELIYDGEVF